MRTALLKVELDSLIAKWLQRRADVYGTYKLAVVVSRKFGGRSVAISQTGTECLGKQAGDFSFGEAETLLK